jgi:hypothetical protein
VTITAVASLLVVSSAAATGTLDQSQTSTSGLSVTAAGSQWVAQTFAAGLTGDLDQVDLFLRRIGNPGDATVQIQTLSGGAPSGTVLGSATVPEAAVTDDFTWVSFQFSSSVSVTAGTEYAVVLSAPTAAGFPSALYTWNFVFGNPYPAGRLVISSNSGSVWGDFASVFDDADTAFKTYVTVLPLPTSHFQCMHGGWSRWPAFKNEGDCVSFVATDGTNPPAG